MLLLKRIQRGFEVASPFLIHAFMIVSVAFYTIFGAYCIRAIENANIDKVNRQNGHGQASLKRVKREGTEFVLIGAELAAISPGLRPCVQQALRELLTLGKCNSEELKTLSIGTIDDCYRYAEINLNASREIKKFGQDKEHPYRFQSKGANKEEFGWTLHNAIVFTFTLITTIGYGHVAPATTSGRVFCLFYGLIGVPLALLTIADMGLFLSKLVRKFSTFLVSSYTKILKWRQTRKPKSPSPDITVLDLREIKSPSNESLSSSPKSGGDQEEEEGLGTVDPKRHSSESIILAITFCVYLLVGSFLISLYEPHMTFFTALYFNFVSLTTIGLGDIVPKNSGYLVVTFIYIAVGLALTTMIIELAADVLKKIHYAGRKLENVAATDIWFGGKKMKLTNLIRHLGDQLNIPIEELQNFDIQHFVEDSLKAAGGELKKLSRSTNNKTLVQQEKPPALAFGGDDEDFINYTSDESPLGTARSTTSFDPLKQRKSAR